MEPTLDTHFMGCLRELCNHSDVFHTEFRRYLNYEGFTESDKEAIMTALSEFLLAPDCTVAVAHCVPDLVLELLLLAEDRGRDGTLTLEDRSRHHKQMCVALGKLVNLHPDAVRFSLQYFKSHHSPFHDMTAKCLSSSSVKKRKFSSKKTEITDVTDLEIVGSCYSLLQASSDYIRQCWNWSQFMKLYVGHTDDFVCWLACECVADITGMTDIQRHTFMNVYLSPESIRASTVRFDSLQPNCTELKQGTSKRKSAPDENVCRASHMVVSVCGIQLPVLNPKIQERKGCLVLVNSTLGNLKSLALAVASGRAVCLQGPVGSGKTSLVEHLALLTGRNAAPHFLKVQLGDQTDSKMLLGSYRCTDVPGEFVWQPGVLTQAVTGGHWILLEDIDSSAPDVASVLASLVETGTLSVPGYRDCVSITPGFQLFVTKRLLPSLSGFHSQALGSTDFLEKHWVQINVEPLSRQELVQIVDTKFPLLKTIASRIVEVFLLFSVGDHSSTSQQELECARLVQDIQVMGAGRRLTSTRDLIKWCTRSVEGFDVSSQESALKLFQDAVDIFCCSVMNPEARLKLATSIGACLGVVKTKADYFCNSYKPSVKISQLSFVAGRVSLPRQVETVTLLDSATGGLSFAFTRPAACLLERVACCVAWMEPVLLVGETGTGKTSAVQYLADKTGHRLVVINMNQQSDSADLLGGYKPIDLKYIVGPVREEFEVLFRGYFSVQKNVKFLEHVATCFNLRHWSTLLKLMKHSHSAAMKRLVAEDSSGQKGSTDRRLAWQQLGLKLLKLETQLKAQNALAFAFIEGSLVKALREGSWVLLDEINLASAETLECLSGLLEGSTGSLYLLERGDQEPIQRHPEFRLFACMNPATDVGKKDLPPGLRNRFTEFFMDELTENCDLTLLVGTYLRGLSLPDVKLENIVKFYLNVRKEAAGRLTDGTGHKPHYSLRTLCRALSVAALNKCGSVPRSLYEGLCLSFLTQLDYASHPVVEQMVAKAVVGSGDVKSILKQPISPDSDQSVCFEGYWVPLGKLEPNVDAKYIVTPSVRRNLCDLVRIVSIGRHPVLLQGETSVGKTSLITYLAKASGNLCVRINNHEHTDLQEYIGSYSADEQGHLVFREGVLVEAMRHGHWIILDELNLAPTDVLEALNRVLDDNRELFIPETQETVKAHASFMLFATQNPPGLYGGRKMLSRAFRNRFVELHFDEIPANELVTILHKRCDMPLSYCKKMVAVMTDLQLRRRGSAAFAGKQGFITLRDLFRWGERYRLASQKEGMLYDWDQHIADEGYLVLAGRVRKQEERHVIQEVIKKHINRTVDPDNLFTLSQRTSPVTRTILEKVLTDPLQGFNHIVWTYNMRRLAVLVGKAFQFEEPVLLVGETGCGKTTVCQMLARIHRQSLYTVNCHMHTESSDFLGGLRPVRDRTKTGESARLFEWVDGPLIEAMQRGDLFLADEISLADDSVLERLNSLLEPERKLLLAEKGGGELGTEKSCVVTAAQNFHFIGTMNPGGDYGKKELSPALRNRLTEIWCESCTDRQDLLTIVEHNLNPALLLGNQEDGSSGVGSRLLDFIQWFTSTDVGKRFTVSVRDILSWVNFINVCTEDQNSEAENHGTKKLDLATAYIHGACLTFLDSFGSGITSTDSAANLKAVRSAALKYLMKQMELDSSETAAHCSVAVTDTHFGISPFYIRRGNLPVVLDGFTFSAPTTGLNASRVLRALQLKKPVLLEGSPGVGKTSLVAALAKAAGHQLTRINVSDQTDVSDLFGADLPMEGGEGGRFAWRDGPFLQALKAGHWILLDELNLASQSVLEGLNACLDHRGEVFIPELGKTFHIQSDSTRLFGAQNPLRQGGARRGLPQSFLNRFTQVYIDCLTEADLEFIIRYLFPALPSDLISRMVKFNSQLVRETGELRLWGQRGAPWELNLRDLCRWCEAILADSKRYASSERNVAFNPGKFIDLIYVDRMRTEEDREKVKETYVQKMGSEYPLFCSFPRIHITHSTLFVDDISMSRTGMTSQMTETVDKVSESVHQLVNISNQRQPQQQNSLMLLRRQFPVLRSLTRCVDMNWLAILVGSAGSGKTSAVHLLSQLLGQELRVLSINSAVDTTEILGGFEQADYSRHLDEIAAHVERLLMAAVRRRLMTGSRDVTEASCGLLRQWEEFRQLSNQGLDVQHQTLITETGLFGCRLTALQGIVVELMTGTASHQLGQQTCEAELKVLEHRLNKLAQNVAKEGSLNAGGKFEWIDSVLVKCLQDGCWLLVDNVNLCSPAVLDRLNALLEPGGILTIGERGVGPDGQLVTICPHPDFRLFLTMDPHNGEISRAMRNRGVEIYLPGPQEEEYSSLDLRSLLYNAGLRLQSQQDVLLSVHNVMTEEKRVLSLGEPRIAQLLDAALLISQQISLGQCQYEAFLSSCSDVYIKSCVRNASGSSRCSDLKQKLSQLLTETLHSSFLVQETCHEHLEDGFAMDVFTLNTSRVKVNASFAVLKQQGSVLKAMLEACVSSESKHSDELREVGCMKQCSDTRPLNQLLDVHDENIAGSKVAAVVNVIDLIPNLLLMFYGAATQSDVELRHEWLLNLITECKRKCRGVPAEIVLKKYQKVCEMLKRTLCQAFSSSLNFHVNLVKSMYSVRDLPWDIHLLPHIAAFCGSRCSACVGVNKLSLLLWFTLKKIQTERVTEETLPGKQKSLTVMEYSTALMHGTLADDITSHCVITKFSPLIRQFDECFEAALKSEDTSLDVAQCSRLYEALEWRFRLSELGDLQLVCTDRKKKRLRTRNLIEEAVAKLSVHYRWLSKWTVPSLQLVLNTDEAARNGELVSQLEYTLHVIDASLAVSSSALLPVGKHVRQFLCQPIPHASKQQVELWQQMQRLSGLLSLWPGDKWTHHAKSKDIVGFLQTQAGMKARLDLVRAHQWLVRGDNTDQVSYIIKEVEKSCQESGLTHCSPCTISKENGSVMHSNSEVPLWPVHEVLCLALSGALKRALCQQNGSVASCQDIARNLSSLMLPLPSIPPILVSMIKFLAESNELQTDPTSDRFKNLIPELIMVILQHSELSPSVKQLKHWLSWRREASDGESNGNEMEVDWMGADDNREDAFPLHCPLMTNIVTSFALPNCQSSSTNTTLGSHRAYKRQLSVLKEVLWRNTKVLSAPELNYKLNDALSVQSFFRRFVRALLSALGSSAAEEPGGNCVAHVEQVVQILKDYNGGDRWQHYASAGEEKKQFADVLVHLADTVTGLEDSVRTIAGSRGKVRAGDVSDFQMLVSAAESWVLLGFLQVVLYADLGLMDPVAKRRLKLQYVSEELEETGKMLYAQELQSRVCSTSLDKFDDSHLHPRIVALRERWKQLVTRQCKLNERVAARPDPPLFDSLAKETLHYSKSLASGEVVLNMHRRLVDAIHKLDTESKSDKEKMAFISRAEDVLREEKVWQESQLRFYDKLNSRYCSWYPDMVMPLLSAATQLCYGMRQLATVLEKAVIQTRMSLGNEQLNLNKLLHDLVRFPSLGEGQSSLVSLVNTCTSDSTVAVINRVLSEGSDLQQARRETYCLIKSSLEELKNLVMIRGELKDEIWVKITQLLDHIVRDWNQQEDERKQKAKDEESLFITKCRTLSDAEQDAREVEEMFPSSGAGDFGDLQQQATLEQVPVAEKALNVSIVDTLTEKDMDYICQLHSHIVRTYTSCAWLSPALVCGRHCHLKPDFITPLLQRYKIFGLLLENLSRSLDSSLDIALYPSLSLLTSATLAYIEKGRTKFSDVGDLPMSGSPSRQGKFLGTTPKVKIFDFYRDGFVEEVKQCFPVLMAVTNRVRELFAEWPDHPTLKQMLVIIQRILNFPLTSPVSRFLTGLELLLDKIHEWEENAHSGVSLAALWKSVTDQIGSWRKLELQCWKDSLDNVARKAEAAASKWWFYIYSLVESFTAKQTESSALELVKTFQKFMEQSSLGEYEARLNILFAFHCHVVHMQQAVCRDEVMNILWNVYHYYSQFSEAVAARIRDLRSPIEKKLKDCVKIFRWDDISHWAIKEAIKKVHKTLHKHIKQFQEVLNQPVTESLTNPSSETGGVNVGMWDRPQRHQPRTYQSLLEPMNFIADTRLKKLTVELDDAITEGSLLNRSGSLFMKARKLCRETILNTPYAKSVQTVEGLITEVIETSNHLRNLEVSADLPKPKQKSQAKNFLQQKRKALADLFRGLQQIGLSYRTGLVYWSTGEVGTHEFTLPPVDLRAAFQHLKNRRVDGQLLSLWNGCEIYFLRSVARLALLNICLQNPSRDLGPPAVERCRGFAAHLMVLAREQKLLLCDSSQLLCSLRSKISQLAAMEETAIILPRQSVLQSWLERLKALLVTCTICLEQFRIFLYCCPSHEERDMNSDMAVPALELSEFPAIVQATKGDHTWNLAEEKVKYLLSAASKLKYTMEKSEIVPSSLYGTEVRVAGSTAQSNMLMSHAQYELLVNGYNQIEEFVKDIGTLKTVFEQPNKAECQESGPQVAEDSQAVRDVNPMISSLTWLQQHMVEESTEFSLSTSSLQAGALVAESGTMPRNTEQEATVKDFREETEKFLKNLLVAVQDVYKKCNEKSEEGVKQNKDVENNVDEGNQIEGGQLKVFESLSASLSMFRMTQINEGLHRLMQKLVTILDAEGVQEGNVCKRLLLLCLPCLDQLVLFYQFFVTQQVALYRVSCKLLSVLLAIFLELAQKGFCIPPELAASEEESQKDSAAGGQGLGEGEGEKDISDQIESEEQLEDARPKGEEKTEENEDCKEEEKGIEMSEDFEGRVQDFEQKADEEGDSDEENEEEEPDKEMGETDAGADRLDQQIWGSDSEDEGEENKDDERGSGEKIGDPELAANEGDNKPEGESDEEITGKQEPKRKEINEMDDPDENDDQIDPYHGKHEPQPEPEPLDLPEDLQLDDGERKDGADEDGQDENPFDIDKMKEQRMPEEEKKEKSKDEDLLEEDEQIDSDDEETEEDREKEQECEESWKSDSADAEGGGSKDEEKAGDEPKVEPEKEIQEECAKPSEDRPAEIPAEPAAEMDQAYGSKDQVTADKDRDKDTVGLQPPEESSAERKDDKQGVGQAQAEQTDTGHRGDVTAHEDNVQTGDSQKEQNIRRRQHLQESDSNRSLGEVSEPVKKKLRMVNMAMEEEREEWEGKEEEEGPEQGENADMYQHIREAKEKFDTQALDAATKEQAEKQPVLNLEEENGEEPKEGDNMELQDDTVPHEDEIPIRSSEKVSGNRKHSQEESERASGERVDEGGDAKMSVEVDGDKVETLGAARGSETMFHTMPGEIMADTSQQDLMSPEDYHALRSQLESQLATWSQPPPDEEAAKAWELFSAVTSGLARDLSEQLRLVLEPTRASRLRGDYRTGRRISMRKVIPYIASQFRKDKIWLRRTKPSKREYQIVLAIDDSSSMADNHSKELAFESLALVSRALTLLEAGELAVISFGETSRVLHQLGNPFTEKSGASLLQKFSFEQKNTRVGQLVDFATTVFTANRSRPLSSNEHAQLLVIVSDGRVMSEGPDKVKQAVRRAKQSGIFMVFVIVDNPESKDSILDIQQPIFSGTKCLGFSSYLDSFPFPFYLILRDINALPSVLSDALRQWFELVTNMDK